MAAGPRRILRADIEASDRDRTALVGDASADKNALPQVRIDPTDVGGDVYDVGEVKERLVVPPLGHETTVGSADEEDAHTAPG